jgi:hypothetical protein
MNKIDINKYNSLINSIKDNRELIGLLIRYLCSKGSIDFREWVLFLTTYNESKSFKKENTFSPQKKAA